MTAKEVIESFDKLEIKGFDEYQVSNRLNALAPENIIEVPFELKANAIAFGLSENNMDEDQNEWGTYFRPMMVWNNPDGTTTESPSIKYITPEMVDFWEKEGRTAINPIIRARLLGVVFDFKKKINGLEVDPKIALEYIDALIKIAEGNYHLYEVVTFQRLRRALKLSIAYNNKSLIERCKNQIISFENQVSKDDMPGLWVHSYDLLIDNKKSLLTIDEENGIIAELESKLTRLSTFNKNDSESKFDPWAAEAAAKRLATYYRKKSRSEDVKRVLLKLGEAFEHLINNEPAFQSSGRLEHLYRLYTSFNLKEESENLLLRIRDLAPMTMEGMKEFSQTFEIPKGKLEEYTNAMTAGLSDEVINRIIYKYIPSKEEAKKQIFDLASKAPMQFLMPIQLQDNTGRVVATIGPLDSDLEGRIVRRISENFYISAIFLRSVLNKATVDGLISKSIIVDNLKKCPIINQSRLDIITRGLDAFFSGDHLVCMHLLIPQIEETVRQLVELAGGNTYKQARNGGFHLKTFDEILRDPIVLETFGEDLTNYFKLLFTDPRGWNLRNDVCHGLAGLEMFNSGTADRILHALLCVGSIRVQE